MQNKITQAFILGAGLGTRLRPLTNTIPKVMVPIAPGKPLLEHVIESLAAQGITDIIINVHYLPGVITSYFGDGGKWGVRIRYSDETEKLMETAGALKEAEQLLDEQFIFIYGDELHFFDFTPAIEEHFKNHATATIVLKNSDIPRNGEIAEFDPATKKIGAWHTRPHAIVDHKGESCINSGLYVLSKKILDYIPTGVPVKLDGEVIPKALAAGEPMYAFPIEEPILDVGTPEKYEYAKQYYAEHITR